MLMIKATTVDINVNLKAFSQQLYCQGLMHRISEESGQQVLYASNENEAIKLRQALREWMQQPVDVRSAENTLTLQNPRPSAMPYSGNWARRFYWTMLASPVTWLLIMVSLLVAAISGLGANLRPVQDLFYPLLPTSGLLPLLTGIDGIGNWLRTLTPMFLHFGELHLVFNMLWLWFFGQQLEARQSKSLFLLLVLLTAFVSNSAQYMVQGSNNFGGMSGVVYGLVGYAWIIHFFMPQSRLMITNSMFSVFIIALVAMEILASSWIATTAHAMGLLTGLVFGLLKVLVYRLVPGRVSNRQHSGGRE